MIYSIKGSLIFSKILDIGVGYVAIDTSGGVAYELKTTAAAVKNNFEIGEVVVFYIYLHFRENSIELFGFLDRREKDFFKLLTSVSGVGPGFALSILSYFNLYDLARCIQLGDVASLSKCKGIGIKTANRIILELKEKISNIEFEFSGSEDKFCDFAFSEKKSDFKKIDYAVDALISLGYCRDEALKAVSSQSVEGTVEEMVKGALKFLVS